MTAGRDALVAFASASIARGSKSFAAASRLFDPATRERVWLLYAWCRACDDMIDGQDHGGTMASIPDPAARIARVKALTDAAMAGHETGHPAFDCLALVARECALPRAYVDDVVEGFVLDSEGWAPEAISDLLRYCYHVAGAVGCLMAIVMGVAPDDEATIDRACDLGLAFQLANVARDVVEDAAAGRCYLPRDWLRELDVSEDALLSPDARPRLALLTGRLANLAARYEASARAGTPALSFRSAWAVLAAAGIYGGIARKVAAAGERALDRRVATGKPEKLTWVLRSAGQSAARARLYPSAPRDPDLWPRTVASSARGAIGAPMFNDRSDPLSLLATRRSGKPRALVAPGPNADEMRTILSIGMRTPDHGKLAPWRFVIVPTERREAFAQLLADAYARQRPDAGKLEREANAQFAHQAPALVVVLSAPVSDSNIPLWEQQLSAGAAAMNILHATHAMGYAGGWLTGWAAYDDQVRDAFGGPDQRIAGFLFLGTPGNEMSERPRPAYDDIVSVWR